MGFSSSIQSRSTLWIECRNLIFLKLLVKALTPVASSCTAESHYRVEGLLHVHTNTCKMAFCLSSSANIDSLFLRRLTRRCSFSDVRTVIVLFIFDAFFVFRLCCWDLCLFLSLLSRDWPWPVSFSLTSLIIASSCRFHREKWLKNVFTVFKKKKKKSAVVFFFLFFLLE